LAGLPVDLAPQLQIHCSAIVAHGEPELVKLEFFCSGCCGGVSERERDEEKNGFYKQYSYRPAIVHAEDLEPLESVPKRPKV
jgi:hypothetical protein